MRVRMLNYATRAILVCFSVAAGTSWAEDEPDRRPQDDAANVQFNLQPYVQPPLQNTFAWQPNLQQPLNARFTWQAQQPNNAVWSLVAAAHSNPLGVEVAPADAALRAQLGLDDETGVVVTSVRSDSEAEKSGLKAHDLILRIGETSIESAEAFNKAVTSEQGKDAELQIMRQGKRLTLPIQVPERRTYDWVTVTNDGTFQNFVTKRYRLGLVLAEADPTLRSQLRLDDGEGLVVTKVLPDTPAAEANLLEHDILIELDGKSLTTVDDLNAQVQEIQDREVGVTLLRGGREMRVELAPQIESGPTATLNLNYVQPMQPMQRWFDANLVAPRVEFFPRQVSGGASEPPASAAEQVAALREQLAAMQQSLERLAADLKPAEESQPDDEPQQEP